MNDFSRNSKPNFGTYNDGEEKKENPCKLKFQFQNKESNAFGICQVYDYVEKKAVQMHMKEFEKNGSKMSFLFMDELFFMNGFNDAEKEGGNDEWYGSTAYRLSTDNIAVFCKNQKKPVFTGTKKEAAEKFPFMSVGVYIYAYLPERGALVKIQLTASGRAKWFEFKDAQGEKPLDFKIISFAELFNQKFKTKKQADVPVFTPIVATDSQNAEADLHFPELAEFTGRIKFLQQMELEKKESDGAKITATPLPANDGNGDAPPAENDDLPF